MSVRIEGRVEIDHADVGVALLISNDYAGSGHELEFTHRDSDSVKLLFKEGFRYKVYQSKNATKEQFISWCKRVAEYKYPKTCKRMVVYFSGHGKEGAVQLQDGASVAVNDVISHFKPNIANNDSLAWMVRMFFIDACRGGGEEAGGYQIQKAPIEGNYLTVSSEANIFIAYASPPSYKSYGSYAGSRWTTCLIQALQQSKVGDNLYDVITATNILMADATDNNSQTPEIMSRGLTDVVYFKREAEERLKEQDQLPQHHDQVEPDGRLYPAQRVDQQVLGGPQYPVQCIDPDDQPELVGLQYPMQHIDQPSHPIQCVDKPQQHDDQKVCDKPQPPVHCIDLPTQHHDQPMHRMQRVDQSQQRDDRLELKRPQQPMQRTDQLQQGFGQLELDGPMRHINQPQQHSDRQVLVGPQRPTQRIGQKPAGGTRAQRTGQPIVAKQQSIIQVLYTMHDKLRKYVDMNSLYPYLNRYGILTSGEREKLTQDSTPSTKVDELLKILERKSPKNQKDFLKAIKEAREHKGHQELEKMFKAKGLLP